MTPEEIDALQRSQGFDAGNYASAYETEDYHAAQAQLTCGDGWYRVGFMLGFFSSYELHEIPETYRAHVERLRKQYDD